MVAEFYIGSPSRCRRSRRTASPVDRTGFGIEPNTDQTSSTSIADNVARYQQQRHLAGAGAGIEVSDLFVDSGSTDRSVDAIPAPGPQVRPTPAPATPENRATRPNCARRTSQRSLPVNRRTAPSAVTTSFRATATGSPEITFTESAGSLPPGLTLDDGTLSGTPMTPGTYTFTITASNEFGSDSETYTVVIPAAPTPTPTPTPTSPTPTPTATATPTTPAPTATSSPPTAVSGDLAATGTYFPGPLGCCDPARQRHASCCSATARYPKALIDFLPAGR